MWVPQSSVRFECYRVVQGVLKSELLTAKSFFDLLVFPLDHMPESVLDLLLHFEHVATIDFGDLIDQ